MASEYHTTKKGKKAKKGLWYNIAMKKKRGEKMRKAGLMDKKKKNKIKKVSKALVKASKLHAGQAKVLKKIIKKK
jgi:hypothetical protein